MIETYETLIDHFLDHANPKRWSNKPIDTGNHIYATDGHAWLKLSKEKISIDVLPTDKDEKFFDGVINRKEICTETIGVGAKSVEIALEPFDKVSQTIPCKICEGTGTLICDHCESEYSCEKCSGLGEISDHSKPMVYEDWEYDKAIRIGKNFVSPFQIGRLQRVMHFENAEKILLTSNRTNKPLVFQFPSGIEVVIMPLDYESTREHKGNKFSDLYLN